MNSAAFLKGLLSVSLSTGAVIILWKLFLLRMEKHYAAKWRNAVWLLLAIRLAVPVSLPFSHTLVSLKLYDSDVLYIAEEAEENVPHPMLAEDSGNAGNSSGREIRLTHILTVIWGTVCLLFLAWEILSYRIYRKKRLRWSRPCRDFYYKGRGSCSRRFPYI